MADKLRGFATVFPDPANPPDGYYFVGIWKDKDIADKFCKGQPPSFKCRVILMEEVDGEEESGQPTQPTTTGV